MISHCIICLSKKIVNFHKSNLFLINSIPIALLVINHIVILPLNNHLFNDRDIIKNKSKVKVRIGHFENLLIVVK